MGTRRDRDLLRDLWPKAFVILGAVTNILSIYATLVGEPRSLVAAIGTFLVYLGSVAFFAFCIFALVGFLLVGLMIFVEEEGSELAAKVMRIVFGLGLTVGFGLAAYWGISAAYKDLIVLGEPDPIRSWFLRAFGLGTLFIVAYVTYLILSERYRSHSGGNETPND